MSDDSADGIDDPEIAAMVAIANQLRPFDRRTRMRMLNWAKAVARDVKALPHEPSGDDVAGGDGTARSGQEGDDGE